MRKEAIHCETEELAERVLDKLNSNGFVWDDHTSIEDSDNLFDIYHKNTAYYLNGDFVTFGTADDAEWFGYSIVKAEDFLARPNTFTSALH